MNTVSTFAAASAMLLLTGGFALADCVDTTASTTSGEMKTPPIAKDGSKAPLEVEPSDSAKTGTQDQAAQKDGSTMPLASQEGGGDKNLATSQQDVEAQQKGDQSAAAKAAKADKPC
jgi:hypothetical protein